MGASGRTTIDFGAFPGGSDASVAVTGQSGIVAGSEVEAWIEPDTTVEHSADEHMIETIQAFADRTSIIAGTGFTIRAFNTSQLNEPLVSNSKGGAQVSDLQTPTAGGIGTRLYGRWNVGWVWV